MFGWRPLPPASISGTATAGSSVRRLARTQPGRAGADDDVVGHAPDPRMPRLRACGAPSRCRRPVAPGGARRPGRPGGGGPGWSKPRGPPKKRLRSCLRKAASSAITKVLLARGDDADEVALLEVAHRRLGVVADDGRVAGIVTVDVLVVKLPTDSSIVTSLPLIDLTVPASDVTVMKPLPALLGTTAWAWTAGPPGPPGPPGAAVAQHAVAGREAQRLAALLGVALARRRGAARDAGQSADQRAHDDDDSELGKLDASHGCQPADCA